MKRTMGNRITAILMATALMTTILTGCGSSSASSSSTAKSTADAAAVATSAADSAVTAESDSSAAASSAVASAGNFTPKEYTLAVPFMESGYTPFVTLRNNFNTLEKLTNGKIINDARQLTPDDELSFVEAQCAAGVNGLILTPSSDSILPTVTKLCEDAGVYWAISLRSISDPKIKALVEASPYYVGNCYEDEETAGYTCGKWMGEKGYKKIAILSQTKGDTTCDTREVGLAKACKEYGIQIVGESRGNTQASDISSATQSFLAANPDLNAIFYVGTSVSGAQEACIKAIQDAGRTEVKFVGVDFPNDMVADFNTGIDVYNYAQISLSFDCYMATIKVINAIQGYPLDKDGKPTSNHMYMVGVDSAEAAQKYAAISGNENYQFFSDEDIQNKLLKWNNPELTQETLQDIIDSYSVN